MERIKSTNQDSPRIPSRIETKPAEVKFEIKRLIEVDPVLVKAMKEAMTALWQKHVKTPVKLKLYLAAFMFDKETGQKKDITCQYTPSDDSFYFAFDHIKETVSLGVPLMPMVFLLSAHEVMHKIQFHRGDKPKLYDEFPNKEAYLNDQFEVEAWEEAIKILVEIYPTASGEFYVGTKRYVVEALSK